MRKHRAEARWNGGLKGGEGEVKSGNGAVQSKYSYASRFGDSNSGTSPEELIGAAHSGCFSMFLSALLEKENLTPEYVETKAVVTLGEQDGAPTVTKIDLTTDVKAQGLGNEKLQQLAQDAKKGCPISKALGAVPEITLQATLKE
ncbi:OsmC family peroxiredoxin [Pontibacter korlensis]|uniref:Peroxiredoxin n=1 Tax=Pontibacter korlensis TaxID=400092 RepID=A0A0E3UX81_9BACT|nr:OsmC family peroxiredoxin [Pontibacter korlensis]AKD03376.1 peroxiredoxin [Pontibacter korlensis]